MQLLRTLGRQLGKLAVVTNSPAPAHSQARRASIQAKPLLINHSMGCCHLAHRLYASLVAFTAEFLRSSEQSAVLARVKADTALY